MNRNRMGAAGRGEYQGKDVPVYEVYVSGIPLGVSEKRIREIFSPAGKVIKCVYGAKLFGFVGYDNPDSVEKAIRLFNNTQIEGYTIRVTHAKGNKQDGCVTDTESEYRTPMNFASKKFQNDGRGDGDSRHVVNTNVFNAMSNSPGTSNYSSTDEMSLECRVCGSDGVLRCSSCKSVRYCGAECQLKDWPTHQSVCLEIRRLNVPSGALSPQVRSPQPAQGATALTVSVSSQNNSSPTQRTVRSSAFLYSEAKQEQLKFGESVKVMLDVSAFVSPNEFYLVKAANQHKLEELGNVLTQLYANSSGMPGFAPGTGELCVAHYQDKRYHRVYVKEVVGVDYVRIFYVDKGLDQLMPTSELRRINSTQMQIPIQAMRVKLDGIPSSRWSENSLKEIQNIIKECQVYHTKAVSYDVVKKCYNVQLNRSTGENITGILDKKGLIKLDQPLPNAQPDKQVQQPARRKFQTQGPGQKKQNGSWGKGRSSSGENNGGTGQAGKGGNKPKSARGNAGSNSVPLEVTLFADSLTKGQKITFSVISFDSPSQFWIHLNDKKVQEDVCRIQAQLSEHFKSANQQTAPTDTSFCESDPLVAAIYRADGEWYRAKIVAPCPQGYAVQYVDFGNKDATNQVRRLPKKFYNHPTYSVECSLAGIVSKENKPWTQEASSCFKRLIKNGECVLRGIVEEVNRGLVMLNVLQPESGESLSELLVKEGCAEHTARATPKQTTRPRQGDKSNMKSGPQPSDKISSAKSPRAATAVSTQQLPVTMVKTMERCSLPEDPVQVIVLDAPSIDCLTVLAIEEHFHLHTELSSELMKIQNGYTGQYKPQVVGELVLAMFETDWFRAEVLAIDKNKADLLYIDYGNKASVTFDKIAHPPPSMSELPVFGVTCSLDGVQLAPGTTWTPTNIDLTKPYLATVIGKDAHIHRVKLADDQGEIGQRLILGGVAIAKIEVSMYKDLPRWSAPVNATMKCSVLAASTASNIYIITDADTLQTVRDLLDGSKLQTGYQPSVLGELVVAKFSEDQQWYRAEVMELDKKPKVTLRYIDYGNLEETTCEHIAMVTPELKSIKSLGMKCHLAGVPETTPLPDGVLFPDVIYDVKFRSQDEELYHIELYQGEVLINKKLTAPSTPISGTKKPNETQAEVPSAQSPTLSKTNVSTQQLPVTMVKAMERCSLPEDSEPVQVAVLDASSIDCLTVLAIEKYLLPHTELNSQLMKIQSGYTGQYKPQLVGELVLAMFETDWFRAEVIAIHANKADLLYIDFGNKASVTFDKIAHPPPSMSELPVFGINCSMDGLKLAPGATWSSTSIECNKPYLATVTGKLAQSYTVKLADDQGDIGQRLIQGGVAIAKIEVSMYKDLPRWSAPVNATMKCSVLAASTASNIYIITDADTLQTVRDLLDGSKLQTGYQPSVLGELVVAKFSEDQQWYRAEVMELDKKPKVTLRYIDYGNLEETTCEHIAMVTPELKSIKSLGMKCHLAGVPETTPLADGVLSPEVIYDVKFRSQDEELYHIELYQDEVLINKKLTAPSTPISGTKKPNVIQAEVPSAQSPTLSKTNVSTQQLPVTMVKAMERCSLPEDSEPVQVAVLDASSIDCLTVLAIEKYLLPHTELNSQLMKIQSGYTGQYKPQVVGELVLAMFETDWFRAEVLAIHSNKADLLYIDFGNKASVTFDKIAHPPPSMTEVPVYGINCSMDGLKLAPGATWSSTSIECNKPYLATVTGKLAQSYTVKLADDQGDIGQRLIQGGVAIAKIEVSMYKDLPRWSAPVNATMKCSVLAASTASNIYIITDADTLQTVRDLLDGSKLQTGYQPSVLGELVVAKFSEDQQWYRAEVMELDKKPKVTLRYIDYGNLEETTCDHIAMVTPELKSIKSLGMKCHLAGVPETTPLRDGDLSPDVIYDVKFRSQDEELYHIELYQGEVLINKKLVSTAPSTPISGTKKPNETQVEVPSAQSPTLSKTNVSTQQLPVTMVKAMERCSLPEDSEPVQVAVLDASSIDCLTVLAIEKYLLPHTELNNQLMNMQSGYTGQYKPQLVGELVLAMFETDWFRAEVLAIHANKADLLYIDFGNKASVTFDKIAHPPPSMSELPVFGINCSMDGLKLAPGATWSSTSIECNKPYLATVTGKLAQSYKVKLADDQGDIGQRLIQGGVAIAKIEVSMYKDLPRWSAPVNATMKCSVLAASTASNIYIISDADTLQTVRDLLDGSKLQTGYQPSVLGELVVAKFSEDQQWYRAEVMELDKKPKVTLRYIDYGNLEETTCEHIAMVTPELKSIKSLGMKCHLAGVPETTPLPDGVLSCDVIYDVKFRSQDEELYHIELYQGEVLINKKLTAPSTPISGTKKPNETQVEVCTAQSPTLSKTNVSTQQLPVTMVKAMERCSLPEDSEPVQVAVLDASSIDCLTVLAIEKYLLPHTELSSELMRIQSGSTGQYKPQVVGELVLAMFETDWFRAEVIAIHSNKADLLYIDFGNKASVTFDKIAHPPPSMSELPVFGINCSMDGLKLAPGATWSSTSIECNKPYLATVTGKLAQSYTVKLADDQGDIGQRLIQGGVAIAKIEVSMYKDLPRWSAPVNATMKCSVLAASTASNIYIITDADTLQTVRDLLDGSKLQTGYQPSVLGELVVAKFSEDQQWYRAEVMELDKKPKVTLRYIDYGNLEETTCEHIAMVTPELKSIKSLGMKCHLAGVPETTPLPDGVLSCDVIYDVKFRSQDEELYHIELYQGEVLINKKLTSPSTPISGTKKPNETQDEVPSAQPPTTSCTLADLPPLAPLTIGQTFEAYTIHVNSASDLYIFALSDQEMQCQLATITTGLTDNKPCLAKVGDVVSVRVDEIYRMVVTNIKDDLVSLKSIDYGFYHECSMSEVRELHEEFKKHPRTVHQCRLAGIESAAGGEAWTDNELVVAQDLKELQVKTEVRDIVAEVNYVAFTIEVDDVKGDAAEVLIQSGGGVRLTANGRVSPSQSTKTSPTSTEKSSLPPTEIQPLDLPEQFHGKLILFNSADSFYVQPENVTSLMEEMQTYCQSVTYDKTFRPEVGHVCCVYHRDHIWYRARVLEKDDRSVLIHFIDIGDTATILYSRIRPLTTQLAKIPPQAVHCKLANVTSNKVEQSPENRLNMPHALPQTDWTLNVISQTDGVYTVKLSTDQIPDYAEYLVKEGLAKPLSSNNSDDKSDAEDSARALILTQMAELKQQLAALEEKAKK